jgi:hypothetical protein
MAPGTAATVKDVDIFPDSIPVPAWDAKVTDNWGRAVSLQHLSWLNDLTALFRTDVLSQPNL